MQGHSHPAKSALKTLWYANAWGIWPKRKRNMMTISRMVNFCWALVRRLLMLLLLLLMCFCWEWFWLDVWLWFIVLGNAALNFMRRSCRWTRPRSPKLATTRPTRGANCTFKQAETRIDHLPWQLSCLLHWWIIVDSQRSTFCCVASHMGSIDFEMPTFKNSRGSQAMHPSYDIYTCTWVRLTHG